MSRPLGPWRVVVLPVAAVALALLGVWFSGAAAADVLRDPGALVRWGLPASSTLSELAGSVTLGRAGAGGRHPAARHAGDRPARSARAGVGTADGSAYPRSLLVAGFAAGAWTVLSSCTWSSPTRTSPGERGRLRRVRDAARGVRHRARPRPHAAADHHRRGRRHGPRRSSSRRRPVPPGPARSCSSRCSSRRSSGTPRARPGTASRRRRWWSTSSAPRCGSARSRRSRCWSRRVGHRPVGVGRAVLRRRRLVLRRRRGVRAGQRAAAPRRRGRT